MVDEEAIAPSFLLAVQEGVGDDDFELVAIFLSEALELAGLALLDEKHTLLLSCTRCACQQLSTKLAEILLTFGVLEVGKVVFVFVGLQLLSPFHLLKNPFGLRFHLDQITLFDAHFEDSESECEILKEVRGGPS